jgi:hypothetical protein
MTPGQERELLQTLCRIAVALEKMAETKKVRDVKLHPNELPVLPVTDVHEVPHDISRTMGLPDNMPAKYDVEAERLRIEGAEVKVATYPSDSVSPWKDPKGDDR